MKYRLLTKEELEPLSQDFKAFLIVNGVHNEEWVKLNEEEPEKAAELVGLFSDAVLQIVYEKMRFAEFRSAESCMVFHFGADALELISLNRKPGSTCDLSTPESIHEALTKHPGELTWFKTQKPYTDSREKELHELLEQGCFVSSEEFWNALLQLTVDN